MVPPRDDEEQRIEREIRARHASDPASILAGRDGGAHLRGASPTPVAQRALLEAEQWLREHLDDHGIALRQVILRRLEGHPQLLEEHLGQPAELVTVVMAPLLASPPALAELVREVDMAWGLVNQERPHFEVGQRPPHPDDPYTITGVHAILHRLLAQSD